MENYTEFKKVVELWQADKQQYVKKSTFAAYSLLITNHLLPAFADNADIREEDVQQFVFTKLDEGLSQKSVKDILIVLKMVLRYGVKYNLISHRQIDIRFPTERERQGGGGVEQGKPTQNYGVCKKQLYIPKSGNLHLFECRTSYRGGMCFDLGRYRCGAGRDICEQDNPAHLPCW